MKLSIDHIPVEVAEGTTVLEAASSIGIAIPVMCHLPGLKNSASCMVCMVEDENSGKFFPSCAMPAAEGMQILTQSAEGRELRKQSLELLLSDHVGDCEAPCRISCPAFMDIPLMNRLIASGDFQKALNVVKEEIAIPMILGYICPAPCEKACHRGTIDKPVSICLLKRFAAQNGEAITPPLLQERGPGGEAVSHRGLGGEAPKIAIIGTGPAGLSAAFYLLQSGYDCTLFDKNEFPGGTMRYLIPDDLLPKEILNQEISLIEAMGARFKMKTKISKEFFQTQIRSEFDAVILATGSRKNQPVEAFIEEGMDPGKFIDTHHFTTLSKGVFSCGNIIRDQKMAVRSAAQGKAAALAVINHLQTKHWVRQELPSPGGEGLGVRRRPRHSISSIGKLHAIEFDDYLSESTQENRLEPAGGFLKGFTSEEASEEAKRCLHCDCRKPVSCKLRLYAEEYGASRRRFAGETRSPVTRSVQHEMVIYETEKCIRCGLCIEIAAMEKNALGLTFIGRGFDVRIGVPFHGSMKEALTNTASDCIAACPTGALALKLNEERGLG